MPTVRVADQTVYYDADVTGDGPSLVLLHGFRNSSASWAPVRTRLDPALNAWYPDLPGCGRSNVPASWKGCTIEAYAEDVRGFCATVGLDHIVLVGHSLGGAIALTIALEHPELLAGLVLVNPTPAEGLRHLSEEQLAVLIDPSDAELEAIARAAFHQRPSDTDFDRLMATVRAASPAHVEGAVRSQRDFHVADRLAEITTPTLVVGGDRDGHVPIRFTLRTAAAIRRCGVQVYHEVGHAPFFEVPDQFSALISRFAIREITES